ncbi:MAG: DUF5719 family protein [Gulosibacter sp.]|uniref:DUF5719 family protein n=1 Tax=Gulosibacter sp. TaxID=2817531 RepID=UPI003F8E77A9
MAEDTDRPGTDRPDIDQELLNPPEFDPYAVPDPEAVAETEAAEYEDEALEIDKTAPSTTASAATVTSAGGSTMARRVRKARRRRRGRKAIARRRSVVGAVAQTFGAIAALGIVATSAWALGWMPLPEHTAVAESIQLAPAAGDQQRVCAGSLQQLGLASDANEAVSVGESTVNSAVSGSEVEIVQLGEEGTDPISVEAPGEIDGQSTVLSPSQSLTIGTANTTGLSVTNCTQPSATQWLMGGATTIGHTLVLDVINPGNTDARVNFEVYSIEGVVVPGPAEVVVGPGERYSLSLGGVNPDASAFAMKVSSTGSGVSAFLHETITDTLTPMGSEIVGATALPATQQSLPGIFVYGRPDAEVTAPAEIGTTLRILNPNEEVATATLSAIDANGEVAHTQEIELAATRIVELPYADVPEGEYTITLDSDLPVLLSGRVSPLDGNEFAWVPSSSTLVGSELVPIPEGPSPRLAIFNASEEATEVQIDGQAVTIEPLATHTVAVTGGDAVEIEGGTGLTAAVHFSAPGQLASAPVVPGNADAEPIRVVK